MPISQDQFDKIAASMPNIDRDPRAVRARVEALEILLERSFHVPGTKIPVGLDTVIGLVPVLGDLITAAMGAYMVWEARNLGMSKWALTRMTANVGIDTVLGMVPLLGDIFDFMWKSNSMNLRIIENLPVGGRTFKSDRRA